MIFLYIAVCLFSLTWAEKRVIYTPIRVDFSSLRKINYLTTSQVLTNWITMPIDHFDPQKSATYQMRYMSNDEFCSSDGCPIFILIGGEWDIDEGSLRGGAIYQLAHENKGHLIYTEHRYYGQSLPYKNFTAENLRFLTVEQALADLAYFINELKSQPRFASSKVIMYGGSYAANVVIWFKQRYPHLVVGGVASSAPLLAKADFTGYLEVVHRAFQSEGGDQCITTIRQGLADTVASMATEDGRRNIERIYRLCDPLDYDNELELGYFSALITWTFSGSVQGAWPGSLREICNNFATEFYGKTPMEKVSGYIRHTTQLEEGSCWNSKYDIYVDDLKTQNNDGRAWYYQTCTEYGVFQTAPRIGTVFDQLGWLTLSFYVDLCKQAFDQRFDEAFVNAAVDRFNRVFGGLHPRVNNVINIHGKIDPWYVLGVYDRDLSETSPTYTVPRASHCFDMQDWLETDTIRMTNAQQAARRIVARWLK